MNINKPDYSTEIRKEHEISLKNRKEIEVNGVQALDSFDNEAFLMKTVMGYLVVRGSGLQLKSLDLEVGIVQITGEINELTYVDDTENEKSKGLFSRLFQ